MIAQTPILQLSAVCKRYGLGTAVETEVLHDISLRLEPAEFVALRGPSGSGKSTLLNIVGLLEPPTSGGLVLEGQRIDELDDARLTELRGRTIGFVFQYHHLLPAFTALENVLLPLMLAQGVLLPQDETLGRQLLASVGLDQALAKRPGELSGGMQQRVALARALARKPRLILADEPTGNLDSASAEEVFALLRRFNKEHGSACLIVTHDASLADRCARTTDLVDGRLAPAQARAISRR